MNMNINIDIKEQGSGATLFRDSFPATKRLSYLGYGKKLADDIRPYLEKETLFDADVRIESEDGKVYVHRLSSFRKKNGIVVRDEEPLSTGLGLFSLRQKAPFVWLELIDPDASEHGSNKWYSLKQSEDEPGMIDANYARHGDAPGSRFAKHALTPFRYPSYMYYLKLYEKLVKGYEDHTKQRESQVVNATAADDVGTDVYGGIQDKDVASLVRMLTGFANCALQKNYAVNVSQVNKRGIRAARKAITELSKTKDVDGFNKKLLELMHIIPRRMNTVRDFLAKKESDFQHILSDETELLDVLEFEVSARATIGKNPGKQNALEKLGLEIYAATDKQRKEVLGKLSDELKGRVKNVFRVINRSTQSRFDRYLLSHGKPRVRQFWHGSKNENWWNIICQGLLLHPDAPITGKMFGHGIYFAPSPTKSWGYTSGRGSYWANGSSDTAFMGLYATAFGTPQEVDTYSSSYSDYNQDVFEQNHPGKGCLYCKGGTSMLWNDEVVFYREEQSTINYIVEFEMD